MSAYMIFNYTITNPEDYAAYPPAARPTLGGGSGAEILVADYSSESLEGFPGHVTVVVRFPSKDAAKAWYESPEYQAVLPLRTANTDGLAVICDEFVMPS